ncbi:MAG: hypothetical protein E6R03_02825 [Hyphomicrobiaceae bacterium]|nr:MAG: hypothetical protein E6R03_02825 [Hyphomicrobiaceae bacterium]
MKTLILVITILTADGHVESEQYIDNYKENEYKECINDGMTRAIDIYDEAVRNGESLLVWSRCVLQDEIVTKDTVFRYFPELKPSKKLRI